MTEALTLENPYIGMKNEALRYAQEEGIVNRAKRAGRRFIEGVKETASDVKSPSGRSALLAFLAVLGILTAVCLLSPSAAQAGWIDDPIGEISKGADSLFKAFIGVFTKGIFQPIANSLFATAFAHISDCAKSSDLLLSFKSLLGSSKAGVNLYSLITSVCDSAVKPVAATLLSIGMLLQLLKIAKKMDQGGGMMPSVREVVALFVWCAVMMYLVRNGVGIVEDLYKMVLKVIKSANSTAATLGGTNGHDTLQGLSSVKDFIKFPDDFEIVDALLIDLLALLVWAASVFAVIVSYFMMISRSVELYMMAMFAPIPFAFFGFDETRSWGFGYVKQFLAVCLSGVIMLVILYAFPSLLVALCGNIKNGVALDSLFMLSCKLIAAEVVLIFGLTKSGSWARNILGG